MNRERFGLCNLKDTTKQRDNSNFIETLKKFLEINATLW